MSDPPKLLTELVPEPLWGRSICRTQPKLWARLREQCYSLAGHRCEICGGRGVRHPVEAHEVWEYTVPDPAPGCAPVGIQTLVRLIALCPRCHQAKHYGRQEWLVEQGEIVQEQLDALRAHILAVNGWEVAQLDAHLSGAKREWARRSALGWIQNLDPVLRPHLASMPDPSTGSGQAIPDSLKPWQPMPKVHKTRAKGQGRGHTCEPFPDMDDEPGAKNSS